MTDTVMVATAVTSTVASLTPSVSHRSSTTRAAHSLSVAEEPTYIDLECNSHLLITYYVPILMGIFWEDMG